MTHLDTLPWYITLPAAFFLMLGSTLALLGALGLVRLKSFYDRLHAPTLGTSWGAAGVLIASMLVSSWVGKTLILHELVIGVLIMATTPVTLMFLGRAAFYRDRMEGRDDLPGMPPRPAQEPATDAAEQG